MADNSKPKDEDKNSDSRSAESSESESENEDSNHSDKDGGDEGDDNDNLDDNHLLVMRSIMDAQLVTSDKLRIGRVGDLEAEWRTDGSLVLTKIITGPQALGARFASHLRPLFHFVFRDKFEQYINFEEVENYGPNTHLRGQSHDYQTGQSERWLVEHVMRWLPGSGYKKSKEVENEQS